MQTQLITKGCVMKS